MRVVEEIIGRGLRLDPSMFNVYVACQGKIGFLLVNLFDRREGTIWQPAARRKS
jgi:hypothetical protein